MKSVSGKVQAKSWQPTPKPQVQKRGNAARPFPSLEAQLESQSSQDMIQRRGNRWRVVAPKATIGLLANVNRAIASESTTDSTTTSPGVTVQAKFTIGAPGDKYEQEADRVAMQVVQRLQAPATPPVAPPSGDGSEPMVQRLVAIPIMQRVTAGKEGSQGPMPADAGFEADLQRTSGGVSPLEAGFRAKVEPLMGADFSSVRVHTDGKSDMLARSIQAKAFTTGQDMYFSKGAYDPGSSGGQELLAHELTHVVQQKGNPGTYHGVEGKVIPPTAPELSPILTTYNAGERVQAVYGEYAYINAVHTTRNNQVWEDQFQNIHHRPPTPSERLRNNLTVLFMENDIEAQNFELDNHSIDITRMTLTEGYED